MMGPCVVIVDPLNLYALLFLHRDQLICFLLLPACFYNNIPVVVG